VLATLLLALFSLPPSPPPIEVKRHVPPPPAPPVAAVRVLEGSVQRGRGSAWKQATGDFRLAPGEGLRTGADGLAVLSLPWMQILVGADAVLGLTPSTVLSAALEHGRVEERADATDILKIVTTEAEVRGRGNVVVRRPDAGALTHVSSLDGTFTVRSSSGTVSVEEAQGAIVSASGETEIVSLPAAPGSLAPGLDPLYVVKGRPARLAWTGTGPRFHVQVTSLDGTDVLFARDVASSFIEVPTRWLGTFRWRVSSVDDRGVEGPASAAGLFCVVEK
jgi:hypothetical protein